MKINHLAVLVCVIILHALGYLWYGMFFADPWQELSGVDPEADPATAMHWISNFLAIVLPVYVLAWLYVKLDVKTWMNGAMYAFIITFSFVVLTIITSDMFAAVPYGLSWINGGNALLGLTVAGAILGAWTKKA